MILRRPSIILLTFTFIGLVLAVLFLSFPVIGRAMQSSGDTTDWSKPDAIAIKQITDREGAQNEPYYFSNLDCSLVEYRLSGTNTMKTGCFTPTAFGMMDTDTYTSLFNGTDEGLQIAPFVNKSILVPWPKATNMLAMSSASTDGSYLSMYKNPFNTAKDSRNLLGQITAKQITTYPEVDITDASGRKLIINPQTISFSDNGSWLVVETLYGSFVRINLSTLDVLSFAPSFSRLGAPGLLNSQISISDDGGFVAISNAEANSFKIYNLNTCMSHVASTVDGFCRSYDYKPYIKLHIIQLQSIRHVRFIKGDLLSLEAQTYDGNLSGKYLLSPRSSIDNLTNYLALGDSYTSGEGAFDYLAGTDTNTNKCHSSIKSYPLLITGALFGVGSGHSVACSGATIYDVANSDDNYRGQVKYGESFLSLEANKTDQLAAVYTNFLPGYLSQQRFVTKYQPSIITVSIGGNDIGFGNILETCAELHVSSHMSDSTCYNTYEDRLEIKQLVDRTVVRWQKLFNQLRNTSPGSTVYAIGYPSVVADKGNCGLNAHLNKSELEFADEIVSYINDGMSRAATAASVNYVDISDALVGFRLCETNWSATAVNGLTAGKEGGPFGLKIFGSESYHPNALGHLLMQQSILKKTNNFSKALSPVSASQTNLLNAPKSGRKIYIKIPIDKVVDKVVYKGKAITLSVDGINNGLKGNSAYVIKIGGPTGHRIATVISDENGSIGGQITIPNDIESGGTTIDIIGDNQGNGQIDITQPIIIPHSKTDSDGDGILDSQDSCPGVENSGQDVDKDGIDDVCDSVFNNSASSSNPDSISGQSASSPTANGPPTALILKESAPYFSEQIVKQLTVAPVNNSVISNTMDEAQSQNQSPESQKSFISRSVKSSTRNTSKPIKKAELGGYNSATPSAIVYWWQIVLFVLIVWSISYTLLSVKFKTYKYVAQ